MEWKVFIIILFYFEAFSTFLQQTIKQMEAAPIEKFLPSIKKFRLKMFSALGSEFVATKERQN